MLTGFHVDRLMKKQKKNKRLPKITCTNSISILEYEVIRSKYTVSANVLATMSRSLQLQDSDIQEHLQLSAFKVSLTSFHAFSHLSSRRENSISQNSLDLYPRN